MTDGVTDPELRAEILRIAAQRGGGKTLCPSEAARGIGGDRWRDLMPAARRIAFDLAGEGLVHVTQHGEPVAPDARGPIRIRWIDGGAATTDDTGAATTDDGASGEAPSSG
ncbi:DUF3253 domain-containing protein [Arthrobacter antioxidans]|uniref:DUF3253 domain-containing protein n=1 Tax=Arthrobacter antioxidans TaxID=2895818 RepID=UPI001FFFE763|nr:DUF3253 domain-containing protein [Arthrobacter antioxidans]